MKEETWFTLSVQGRYHQVKCGLKIALVEHSLPVKLMASNRKAETKKWKRAREKKKFRLLFDFQLQNEVEYEGDAERDLGPDDQSLLRIEKAEANVYERCSETEESND